MWGPEAAIVPDHVTARHVLVAEAAGATPGAPARMLPVCEFQVEDCE